MLDVVSRLVGPWSELGAAGITLFAATLVVGALTFIPRPALCLLGGLLYGFSAFPIVLIASTAGMAFAFLISRYLFRSYFCSKIDGRPKLRAIAKAVDAEGWRLVALLRFASPLPATAVNYALG